MTRLGRTLTVGVAVAALGLAACGSGSGGGGPDQAGGPGASGPADIDSGMLEAAAGDALVPNPCGLFTPEEIGAIAGIQVDNLDENPGLSECWVNGEEIIIYRFDLITAAAWEWNRSHFEEQRGAGPLAGGELGDDSYAMSGPDVKVLVRTGPVQIEVSHSAFGGDDAAFEAGEAVAREVLARADLSGVPDVSRLPDIAPCELLTEDEFTQITGGPFTPFGTPRTPEALSCDFRGEAGELGTPSVRISLDPTTPEQFAARKAEAQSRSNGMITVVDVDTVGDDSFAYEFEAFGADTLSIEFRNGDTEVRVEVGQVADQATAATAAARVVLGKL